MLANLVHETATPGSALEVTLTAGVDDGDLRISDKFPTVGQTIQYSMLSKTTDRSEEGFGVVVTGDKFDRTLPTATNDGTTVDLTSPVKLDFGVEVVDVWATPVGVGVHSSGWWGNWAGASGNLYERNGDAATSDPGTGHTPTKGRLTILPFRKYSANDVKGLSVYLSAGMAGGEGFELYFFDAAPGGGPGQLLATCTSSADPASGGHELAFDGAAVISAPPGEYFVGFIWDYATGTPTIRGREGRLGQSLGSTTNQSYSTLSQVFASWALGDGLPAITSLSLSSASSLTVDINLWLVR